MSIVELKKILSNPPKNFDYLKFFNNLIGQIILPRDRNLLNISTVIIKSISDSEVKILLLELFINKYPKNESIQKMTRCIYAELNLFDKAIAINTKIKYSDLRDIAINYRDKLNINQCDKLIELWKDIIDNNTTDSVKETFFSVLVKLYPNKYLNIAINYVWIWRKELWDLFKNNLKPESNYHILTQPYIDINGNSVLVRNELHQTLSKRSLNILLTKCNELKLDETLNYIIVDGSNLYNEKSHTYFDYNLMRILEKELKNNYIPIYVGHCYRVKSFKNKNKNYRNDQRLFFEIPSECSSCNDDLVWQYLALNKGLKFITNDIGKDHRKLFTKNYYLWYEMNWVNRLKTRLDMPPTIWPRAQLNNDKLYIPDMIVKNRWWSCHL